jgi:hypothetical protein
VIGIVNTFAAEEKPDFAEETVSEGNTLTSPVSMIGIEPSELQWIRILVSLLRHPRPGMPELARQALQYLARSAVDGRD